jgi:hypothetical protein
MFDLARKAAQIRLMQAETEQRRAETERIQSELNQPPAQPVAAPYIPPPPVVMVPNASLPAAQKSEGLLNGRYWNAQSAESRVDFIVGYSEHLTIAEATGWKEEDGTYFPHSPVSFGEIAKGLNRIYDAPENLNIPISFAIYVFQLRVTGKSEPYIAVRLEYLRNRYSAQPPAPDAAAK